MANLSTPSLGITRNADRQQQRQPVEKRFDVERPAELLDAGDAHGEDGHAHDGAPDVHSPRLDRRRTEKCADEGWQEKLEPNACLPDAEFGRQDDPRHGAKEP